MRERERDCKVLRYLPPPFYISFNIGPKRREREKENHGVSVRLHSQCAPSSYYGIRSETNTKNVSDLLGVGSVYIPHLPQRCNDFSIARRSRLYGFVSGLRAHSKGGDFFFFSISGVRYRFATVDGRGRENNMIDDVFLLKTRKKASETSKTQSKRERKRERERERERREREDLAQ